ncbi:hypothetical protein [Pseudomonas sp. B33.4]|uniref:hypothetical protein n=1 Tax=Pseudomonas sp. B33.4 TaxID=3104265 RepID=UPI002ADEB762|nr:hypothetical protein [Pseudomonas sp. B33.4]
MKKIPTPLVDDVLFTTEVSKNSSLSRTSYPHLKNALSGVLAGYQNYIDNAGNALLINSIGVSELLKLGLHKNYNSPPQSLAHIESIRKSSPKICPMCGSPKTTSLDHLLPKEDYPEFSIFSKNLVPACDCNTKRKTNTKDVRLHARVLHPYFDSCLLLRQVTCVISRVTFPEAKIEVICLNPADPMIASLKFHLENVILPSGLVRWLESQWSSLVEYPAGIIHTLPHKTIYFPKELRGYLNDSLQRHDRGYGTPNNWESVFVHGLINSPGIARWIMRLHNQHYV